MGGSNRRLGIGQRGVYHDLAGQWFVWRPPFSKETQARLITDTSSNGDVMINNLELATLFVQTKLFAPKTDTLSHICTAVDNMADQG